MVVVQDPREKAAIKILNVLYEIETLKHLSPQRTKVFRTSSGKLVGNDHIVRSEFDSILTKLEADGIAKFNERDIGLSWGENSMEVTILSWAKFNSLKQVLEDPHTLEGKSKKTVKPGSAQNIDLGLIHKDITKHCTSLYANGHYAEAVEKSFKVVRNRLRKLTGVETGSKAFGEGGLYITGSADPGTAVVDKDFQEAVKFLTMSIDYFRNEKVHVVDGNINSPERAYEYLMLSSLAMRHLDNAKVKK